MSELSSWIAINENQGQGIESGWSSEEKSFFQQMMDVQPNEKVLDLGCGNGVFSHWMNESQVKPIGCDFSPNSLLKAKAFQALTIQSAAQSLPFKNETFDRVVFIEVLEHIPPQFELQVFREILRVLKPNGKLVLHTSPNLLAQIACLPINVPLWFLRKLKLTTRPLFEWDRTPFHVNKHWPWEFNPVLRRVGFKGSVCAYTEFTTFPIKWTQKLPCLTHPFVGFVWGRRFRGVLIKHQND